MTDEPHLSSIFYFQSWVLEKRLLVSFLPWIGCQLEFTQLDLGSLEPIIFGMDGLER